MDGKRRREGGEGVCGISTPPFPRQPFYLPTYPALHPVGRYDTLDWHVSIAAAQLFNILLVTSIHLVLAFPSNSRCFLQPIFYTSSSTL